MKHTDSAPRITVWLALLATCTVFLAFARPLLAATQPFQPSITAPANKSTVATGSPVTISATVSGNANPITKIEFYNLQIGQLIGTATAAPFSVSWTPTATGNTFLRVTAYDSLGQKANSAITTVTVVAGTTPPPPAASYTLTVVNGTVNGAASASLTAGSTATVTAASAPAGQVFKNWSGDVAFANASAATTTFPMPAANTTVTANYQAATTTPPPAAAPLAIASATLPNAIGGTVYSHQLTATGGTAPYSWKILAGSLESNLSLSTSGLISGTVGTASWIYSYPFSAYVSVTDSLGASATASLKLTIDAPAGSTPPAPPPTNGGGTPQQSVYTVTVVNGTANGAASITAAPYATVTLAAGTPPAGQAFKQWSGSVAFADALASTTTFQMPSSNVAITATFHTPKPIPATVAGHPRLWINTSDLPRLRSWAHAGNPIWQQALRTNLQLALHVHTLCFPNGQPANPYPDSGNIDGYAGPNVTSDMVSEQHALVLAFHALVDPDANARLLYAQKARDLFMYIMGEAAKPHLKGAPFRDPIFSIFNRSNSAGETWPLLADWLQGVTDAAGQPVTILTAADKAVIRQVFMTWAEDCITAYTTGGDSPKPNRVTNSLQLLPGGHAYRMTANNYYLNHARLITMMPLAFDPADDPALDASLPDAALGNTLRSYLSNATGAWLYQQFAMFGDPAEVRAALNLPATAKVGLASGGNAVEGGLYGHSMAYIHGQLLAMQTAGFTDPAFCGPQVSLVGSPHWDRYVHGLLSMMVPKQQVDPAQAYLGPVYSFANFGDLLRLWITPDNMTQFALLALVELKQGRSDHLNAARWIALNAVEGGAPGFIERLKRPYSTHEPMLAFMLFDPTDPTAMNPTDPRPGYATTHWDPGIGRILARTDWSPAATFLDFRSGWLSINHQNCDGGQFQFYRKGEWLTKEFSNYDNYGVGQSTIWHNTLSLQNWCASGNPFLQWYERPYLKYGSQYNMHQSAGDPVTTASSGPGYTHAQTDMTALYNRPNQFAPADALLDITHASRSLLWLQPDVVVVYDRASSVHNGFKRFNLTLTATPTLDPANHRATVVTPKGQYFFVHSLLPANGTMTYVAEDGTLTNVSQLEPSKGRLVIEDTTNPTSTRFLHVLQGADAASAQLVPVLLNSTAGDPFTGAIIGNQVALFAVNYGANTNGTAYSAPLATTKHHLSGFAPGAHYSVIAVQNGANADIAVQPSATGAFTADTAGLLVFDLSAALQ